MITDAELMQATLLALTRQNVTGDSVGSSGAIVDDFTGIALSGWVETLAPVYGDAHSAGGGE